MDADISLMLPLSYLGEVECQSNEREERLRRELVVTKQSYKSAVEDCETLKTERKKLSEALGVEKVCI